MPPHHYLFPSGSVLSNFRTDDIGQNRAINLPADNLCEPQIDKGDVLAVRREDDLGGDQVTPAPPGRYSMNRFRIASVGLLRVELDTGISEVVASPNPSANIRFESAGSIRAAAASAREAKASRV